MCKIVPRTVEMRWVASSTRRVIYHDADLIGSVTWVLYIAKSQALSQTVDHQLAVAGLNCWSVLDWLHMAFTGLYIYITARTFVFSLIRKTRKQTLRQYLWK